MLEETAILDSENCMDHHFRYVAITQQFALTTLCRDVVRQDLRLERKRIEQHAVATHFGNLVSSETNAHYFRLRFARASRSDVDRRAGNSETATPNVARCCFEVTRAT